MTRSIQVFVFAALTSGLVAHLEAQPAGPNFTTKRFVWKADGRGFLGLHVQSMTPELRVHFGAPEDEGVLVAKVEEGGPAESAGIRVADIITAVDGESMKNPSELWRVIREKKSGDTVQVELRRDATPMTLTVSVAERDRPVMDLAEYRFVPDIDELAEHEVFIARPGAGPMGLHLNRESMEAFDKAMRELTERFSSGEWEEKLDKLNELDLSAVEKRMREVEKRLQELEKELAKESPSKR